jgi:hypothetical protein
MTLRAPSLAAALLLAAACGGGEDGPGAGACAITYSGAVTERVWCDTPALRTAGGGGYVLWVMAFRGSPSSLDQAGQMTISFAERPVAGVSYGFGASVHEGASGFVTRTFDAETTHEARSAGDLGAVTVRFSSLPATDGPDADGFEGIGVVHATISGTLVPTSGTGDVTLAASF